MNTSIVLTVIADDQPGVIQIVSRVLHSHGGSWTQSSMSSLGGHFAGILLASVPNDKTDACLEELHGLESQGLHVIANISHGESLAKETQEYDLDLVGNDRPGIVHDITGILAAYGVNVHNLETRVEAASMGGGELFRATAQLAIPDGTDVDTLESDLEEMANDMMVDITFEK
jgi:glycine cleavage system regulatory protein